MVIRNDTDRYAVDEFLLTFPSNHEPILYRLRDIRRFQSKIAKFSDFPYGRLTVMLRCTADCDNMLCIL